MAVFAVRADHITRADLDDLASPRVFFGQPARYVDPDGNTWMVFEDTALDSDQAAGLASAAYNNRPVPERRPDESTQERMDRARPQGVEERRARVGIDPSWAPEEPDRGEAR